MKLSLHPDDPPVPVLDGVARIFRDEAAFARAMAFADSPNHGICFCTGTFAEAGADADDGRACAASPARAASTTCTCAPSPAHCRASRKPSSTKARSTPSRCCATLLDAGFDGFVIDDHVPHVEDDTVWGHRSRAHATGYIAGIIRALRAETREDNAMTHRIGASRRPGPAGAARRGRAPPRRAGPPAAHRRFPSRRAGPPTSSRASCSPNLQRVLNQVVVVDNRGGAAGNLGADHVAKAAPDGTTVLLTDTGILTTGPSLFARLPYNPATDLAPVTMLTFAPYIMAVHPSRGGARRRASSRRWCAAEPGRINFAHSGVGALNHLTALVVAQHWGGSVTEVFYRGGMIGIQAAVTNESQLIVNGATAVLPFVKDNRLRAIAVTGPRRLRRPAGRADLRASSAGRRPMPGSARACWRPRARRRRRSSACSPRFRDTLAEPAMRTRMARLGAEIVTDGPDAFRTRLAAETEAWGGIVRARGIRLD